MLQLYSKKIREDIVLFHTEKRFYDNINMIFVALCPRDPFFKEPAVPLTSKKEDVITINLYALILIFWQVR